MTGPRAPIDMRRVDALLMHRTRLPPLSHAPFVIFCRVPHWYGFTRSLARHTHARFSTAGFVNVVGSVMVKLSVSRLPSGVTANLSSTRDAGPCRTPSVMYG